MTPEQTITVIEIMDAAGVESICDIEHDDDGHVWVMLDKDRSIWIRADGTQEWFHHGKLHREDSPAAIWADGSQRWYQRGKLHREDGPAAIEANGTQWWYQRGLLHRDDGPAVIWIDGTQQWWLNGKQLSEAEHARLTSRT